MSQEIPSLSTSNSSSQQPSLTPNNEFQQQPQTASSSSPSSSSGSFECSICFDVATEPVVTRCGHLFCWPCIYRVSLQIIKNQC